MTIKVLDYGCIISEILVPDKDGNVSDINLGFDDMEGIKLKNIIITYSPDKLTFLSSIGYDPY